MKFKLGLLLLSAAILASSCQHEANQVNPQKTESSMLRTGCDEIPTNNVGYNLRVRTAVAGLLEISKNSAFRQLVNEEVALQLDGDDNVLLSKMKDRSEEIQVDLNNALETSISNHISQITSLQGEEFTSDSEIIGEIIDGFLYNDGEANSQTLAKHVQIYIPSVDIVNLNQDPIICINYGYEDPEDNIRAITGYKLNTDGILEKYSVTEAIAEQQLVWVIGVNERENLCAPLPSPLTPPVPPAPTPALPRNSPDCTSSNPCKALRVTEIFLKDEKDYWFNGRDDVAWTAFRYKVGSCQPALQSDSNRAFNSPFYVKVPHSKIQNFKKNIQGEWISTIWDINQKPHEMAQTEMMSILFFEQDNVKSKPYPYRNCSSDNNFNYDSRNDPYGLIHIYYSDIAGTFPNKRKSIGKSDSVIDVRLEATYY